MLKYKYINLFKNVAGMINPFIKVNSKFSIRWEITWIKVLLPLVTILVGVMLATLSVQVYRGYNDGMFDLGNMSQAIWSATKGLPLEFTINNGQLSRLGLHVELIYFLISPLYALFPQPTTLLILQSFLFALGAIPIYRIAQRHLKESRLSLALVIIYLFYPVAQTAVLFDFHGDTLAMPLLLFALDSLEEQHWKSYALFVAMALSCKFYVAVPVFIMGLVILIKYGRQSSILKKVGMFTALVAIAWGGFTFFILRPLFSPDLGVNLGSTSSPVGYLLYYFDEIVNNLSSSWIPRFGVLLLLIMPIIWLSLYSSIWLLPAAVTAIPALLSNGIQYTYQFHDYALAVPFLIYAAIMGASHLQDRWKESSNFSLFSNPRRMILLSLLLTLIFNATLLDTPINPSFWSGQLGKGFDSLRYGRLPRDGLKDALLKQYVPPGVPVAVSWTLAPHLTNRRILFVLDYFDITSQDFDIAIADGLFDYAVAVPGGFTGGVMHDVPYIRAFLQRSDFSLTYVQDGLLFFECGHQAENLRQSIETEPFDSTGELDHVFDGIIGLVDSSVENISTGVYRFKFTWKLNKSNQDIGPLFAVSTLVDSSHTHETTIMRILHVPTEVLYPTTEWKLDEQVIEMFDVRMPSNLASGKYQISTSWYVSNNIYSSQTDSRSRFGDEWTWGEIYFP
jgi:uncharacterized membrane protein